MPTRYQRKLSARRALWSENDLNNAITAINSGTMGVNAAARHFNVPKATLLRRRKSGNLKKTGSLGPSSTLGDATEAKLVAHIKKLQKFGFAPTRFDVRQMAFALADQLKIKHRFDTSVKLAGYDWLNLFLNRHPDLSVRVAEGVSVNRQTALCHETVDNYFQLLGSILEEYQLFNKPGNIFNVDETGLQLNNKPGQVIAAKGSKAVTAITSGERGETISVIACCNGEGTFLPPYCIFKGKNLKEEFSSGMPPGSVVRMSQKSAYVNTEIFFHWLKEHFMPRKPSGKVLLILDGHTSHCNNCEMLEFAEGNGIIMLCLPPHTTHYLQPLDRAVFKSLKSHYNAACNNFLKTNPSRKIGRLQFGQLLAESWSNAAVAKNAISGFRATGIIPFSREAIPDYAFISEENNSVTQASENEVVTNKNQGRTSNVTPPQQLATETKNTHRNQKIIPTVKGKVVQPPASIDDAQPGCSFWEPAESDPKTLRSVTHSSPNGSKQQGDGEDITPGKFLHMISPIAKKTEVVGNVKKRGRAIAQVLTSPEHIELRKTQKSKVPRKKSKLDQKLTTKSTKSAKLRPSKKRESFSLSSTSESDGNISLHDESDTLEDWEENNCAGCGEHYNKTKKTDDWVQCIVCARWLHESCLKYENMCDRCGKKAVTAC